MYINDNKFKDEMNFEKGKKELLDPISEVSKVELDTKNYSFLELKQLNAIFRLVKEIYPDPKEQEFQLNIILESAKPSKFPSILRDLDLARQDIKRIEKAEIEAQNRKNREKMLQKQKQEETPNLEVEAA